MKSLIDCIVRRANVGDLYRREENLQNLIRGVEASVVYRRVSHCLASGLGLKIDSHCHQWVEERSPNHHPFVLPVKWPVGLIEVHSSAENLDEILGYHSFKEFDFKPVIAANSSGGVKSDSIDGYEFSITPSKKADSYHNVSEEFISQFGNAEGIHKVDGLPVDFIRLEGFDEISGGKIYIDLGNKPLLKRKPRNFLGVAKNIGQLPPFNAVSIPVY
jgi:hypothetical protein